jgi:hypothetical protein
VTTTTDRLREARTKADSALASVAAEADTGAADATHQAVLDAHRAI